jgi:GT2 family glycosyltransferase
MLKAFPVPTAQGLPGNARPDVSVVIVSFNTRELLRRCLRELSATAGPLTHETIVIDNASRDGSADMVEAEFPEARLIRAERNLGFGPGNNVAIQASRGRYVILLNSDAFVEPTTIERAISWMDQQPCIAIGGAQLRNPDGSPQRSAVPFPSLAGYLRMVTGWGSNPEPVCGAAPCDVDWIVGAFLIIRREALEAIGAFDPRFFLYYEEVDLCFRARQAGLRVSLLPGLSVIHLGGESAKTVSSAQMCDFSPQLTLWSMRSALLYFRKHHGAKAWGVLAIEAGWHGLRVLRNGWRRGELARRKAAQSRQMVSLILRAWRETAGGRTSPPQPW